MECLKPNTVDQLDRVIGDMKEEFKVETAALQQIKERILHLEQKFVKKITTDAGNDGGVDKAIEAVVGGFVGRATEELESLVGRRGWK